MTFNHFQSIIFRFSIYTFRFEGIPAMILSRHSKVIVEIGTEQLKLCQLREGRKNFYFIKTLRLANLKGPLDEELPSLFKSLGIRNQHVTTYLPRKLVNLRFLEIPSVEPKEVDNIVQLRGVKQIPYSQDEVILSHTLLRSRQDGYSEVVLAFCQRKFVDERINLLAKAGLEVDQIGVGSEGVVAWYVTNQLTEGLGKPQGLVALIDCDSSFSDIIFCRDGEFLFSRSIVLGKASLTHGSEQEVKDFCKEVLQAIELTTEEIKLDELQKAVLIASMPIVPELRKTIETELGLSVEFSDPAMSLKGKHELQVEDGGSFTPLIGFSQKKNPLFNLVPEEMQLQESVEKKAKQIITTGALVLGLFAAISLLFVGHFHQKKVYTELLEKEIYKTQEIASAIEGKLMRINLIEKIKNEDNSFLFYFKKISELLMGGMYFRSVEYVQGKKITLKGNANEMAEIFDFVKTLEESKIFKGVKSEHVSKKKSGDKILANFDIVCRL